MTDSLAREEADRFFSSKERITTHPEDASDSDNHSEIEEKNSSTDPYHSDPGDDEDTLHSMSATTDTATYHLPHTLFDANTGPKGVIADAQSFDRAKKHSLRNTFLNFTKGSYFNSNSKPESQSLPRHHSDSSEKSGSGLDDDEKDDFMDQWRQSRLRELNAAAASQKQQRRQSPSKRKWGFFREVDASGYLDAVEKTASDTVVVVCIYDPEVCRILSSGQP
jgi:hypothetical protein